MILGADDSNTTPAEIGLRETNIVSWQTKIEAYHIFSLNVHARIAVANGHLLLHSVFCYLYTLYAYHVNHILRLYDVNVAVLTAESRKYDDNT